MTSDDTAPQPGAESAHGRITSEPTCERCNYPLDSFACKIRCHIHVDTSWARADH